MTMIVRHQFNNRDWAGPCHYPGRDQRCQECFRPTVQVKPPQRSDTVCSGYCWEAELRKKWRWGCAPQGNLFGPRAREGDDAFLVFRQANATPRLYTIWAVAKVASIDDKVDVDGFSYMYFEPFAPLPLHRWVPSCGTDELVGGPWGNSNHRYLTPQQAIKLSDFINGSAVPAGR